MQTRKRQVSNAFRFSLKSFLPGRGSLSVRRFSVTEAAFLLVLALLTSRGLGVVRQVLFDLLFGTGATADAYYAASYLPETLFDLVAGGALTYAFVPVFLSYEKDHGAREAWRLTSLVFNVILVFLTLIVLMGEFLAPTFVNQWLVPNYPASKQLLTTELTRIMLLQPLLLGLGAVITAALNSRRQFLLSALAVAIYNVGLIGGLLVSLIFPRVGIYGPTYGTLAASALQGLVMVPALVKQGARYSFTWDIRHPGLLEVLRLLIPNSLAVTISSLSPIIDTNFISSMPGGSLAAQRNAYMLFALPFALFSQAIGQAVMPQLSAFFASQRYVRLRQMLVRVLGTSVAGGLLAALVLPFLGRLAVHALFHYGAFSDYAASATNLAVLGYAIALPGQIAAILLVLTFYSMMSPMVPLYTTVLAVLTHYAAILLFVRMLPGPQQLLAIPLAMATDGLITAVLLGILLFRRLGSGAYEDRGMSRLARRRAYQKELRKL